MTTENRIPLADILSITTERLLSRDHMGGIYSILRHMTGQDVFTHQIPTVAPVCKEVLFNQHPFLAELTFPENPTLESMQSWLAEMEKTYGTHLTVEPIDNWVEADPIEDAVRLFGADKVTVVEVNQ